MMNLIFWKKEAVAAGGCRCSRMSLGCGTVEHSGLERHSGLPQHSGSSQSVRPSASERNEGFLLFSEGVFQVGRGLALKGSFTQGGAFLLGWCLSTFLPYPRDLIKILKFLSGMNKGSIQFRRRRTEYHPCEECGSDGGVERT